MGPYDRCPVRDQRPQHILKHGLQAQERGCREPTQLYLGSRKSGPDAEARCVSFLLVSALRKKTGLSFVQMWLHSMKYLWQRHSSKESEDGMIKPKSATIRKAKNKPKTTYLRMNLARAT